MVLHPLGDVTQKCPAQERVLLGITPLVTGFRPKYDSYMHPLVFLLPLGLAKGP